MTRNRKTFLRVFLASWFLIGAPLFFTGFLQAKESSFNNIAAPDEKGPYNVGATTFCATMTGGRVTRIQVFYPTLDPPNCDTKYQVFSRPTAALPIPNLSACFPNQSTNETYFLSSPLCATENSTVAPGPFPLIVQDHGGGTGADLQRFNQLPVHETLASHGFIVVTATHSGNIVDRVLDLSLLIDNMLARNAATGDALFGRIDPDRIGIAGLSAGGLAAVQTVAGVSASGIPAEKRIKAMVVYEPINPPTLTDSVKNDISTISIPYLVMGGDQFQGGVAAISVWFELTQLASPRVFVLTPNSVHHGYQSGSCQIINEAREYALLHDPTLVDPATNSRIDPLTNFINPNAAPPRVCKSNMGTAGANACSLWNQGEAQFFLGGGPGFGGGRNVCTHVGTMDSILSLDTNPIDGLTDSPPFMASDAFTLEPAMPSDILVPMDVLYSVAFWKKFLEGDGRYMRYLAPGYANVHDLEAVVDIRE